MPRALRLLVLGVVAYLLILIITLPASRVTGALVKRLPDLSVHAVSGSVFSGQAGQVVWQGLELGTVHWHFRPLGLLLGRLGYRVELTHPANHGWMSVGVTLTGRVLVQDVELSVLPDRILNHYSPVAVTTSGEMLLTVEEIDLADYFSDDTSALLVWQDAAILEPVNMVLGRLALAIHGADGVLVGEFVEGGELGVSGEVSWFADSRYQLKLRLQPGDEVSMTTLDMLEGAAQLQPAGDYLIEQSGQL